MHTTLVAMAALASVALADNMGKAVVLNKCSYPVKLCNVPASGAGFQQVDEILASGQSYEQTWTKIGDVNGGWSIKLTKNLDSLATPLLQYEYTCKEDGVIWYDLSEVNGNPWSGQDWEISADQGCDPKQAAYRFWNDDAHGMQASCPQSSVITVTLCSKTGGSGSGAPSNGTSPAPAPVYSQPAPAPKPAPSPAPQPAPQPATSAPAPAPTYPAPAPTYAEKQEATTLETSSAPAKTHVLATTVVEVETVYATAYVTVAPQKRHVHHPHQHGHHA